MRLAFCLRSSFIASRSVEDMEERLEERADSSLVWRAVLRSLSASIEEVIASIWVSCATCSGFDSCGNGWG